SDLKPVWCPGCGDFGVLSALTKAMSQCNLDPACTVIVSGIGCSSRLPGFVATYGFHSVHGRVLPVATGIKAARPDLNVIAVGGDGDAYAIGGGHLPHCARRNPNITYLVMNNNVYGLTKGQVSPTSMLQHATESPRIDPKRWRTTPYGTIENTLDPIAQAIAWDLSFVARAFSYKPNQLTDLIAQAIRHKGFSLVDIFSPCPTNNLDQTEEYYKDHTFDVPADHDPEDPIRAFALALHGDNFPIGVIYKHEGKPMLADELQAIRHHFSGEASASLPGLFAKFQS
ncbi:MAG TPA: 2-oxoacid:ferredoxin oxidoreductase subunit beta, partial [Chthonomonadaceae bacterium]|nr:2-oxoacid:ferredoxin oxidoreductase subunit beta [Chthonomonadaceae bacterium]